MALTRTQREYLDKIPLNRAKAVVFVEPHNPKSHLIARRIIRKVNSILPRVKVIHAGSSALKIAGLPDVDLFIYTRTKTELYVNKLSEVFKITPYKNKLDWKEEGFRITLKIANPDSPKVKEREQFFKLLQKIPFLRKRYADVKLSMSGKSYLDYYRTKLDFESRVIRVFDKENVKHLKYLKNINVADDNIHIRLSAERHGLVSFETKKLLSHLTQFNHVARSIAQQFKDLNIDVVVGPKSAGDILAKFVTKHLSRFSGRNVSAIALEKNSGRKLSMINKEILKSISDKNVLIVDDTVKSGETLMQIYSYLSDKLRSRVAGMAVICARNNIPPTIPDTLKFYPFLVQDDFIFSYDTKKCYYCKKGIPFSKKFIIK